MTSDKKSPSAIGVVAPVFSSATDATNPPPSTTIQVPAPSTASDATLVAALTSLVNNVYGEAEGTIYKSVFSRTSKTQIAAHLAAGELAVASSSSTGSKPVGCVFVKRLTPSVGEFGMLAVDPAVRGTGRGAGPGALRRGPVSARARRVHDAPRAPRPRPLRARGQDPPAGLVYPARLRHDRVGRLWRGVSRLERVAGWAY
ncbi:hypothetical protein CIB48_g6562 [Xylaria polymorpha]|nr:hypothetical protein CIB48_g6562 [Xylaria polymorpha]